MPRCKLNLGNCGNFAGKGLFLAVPIAGLMAIAASFFSIQLGSSRQLTPPGPISDGFFDKFHAAFFSPPPHLTHRADSTRLTWRRGYGIPSLHFPARGCISSHSIVVLLPSPLDVRLSHNLIAGPLSQPEAAGVPGELLGHVILDSINPTISCLPDCLVSRFFELCFSPSGEMHTVANQNIISQSLKLLCLVITTRDRGRAMSPPATTASACISLAGQRRGAVTQTWRQLITTRIIRIDLVAVHALINTQGS